VIYEVLSALRFIRGGQGVGIQAKSRAATNNYSFTEIIRGKRLRVLVLPRAGASRKSAQATVYSWAVCHEPSMLNLVKFKLRKKRFAAKFDPD
jgi:hypothetical protein